MAVIGCYLKPFIKQVDLFVMDRESFSVATEKIAMLTNECVEEF
jgi:hypothetical protein